MDNTIAIGKYLEAAIIGGGFVALEIAEALKARGYSKVYLLVRRDVMRSYLDEDMTEIVRDILTRNGIDIIRPASIENIATRECRKCLTLSGQELEVNLVFYATGSRPNVELAKKAGLDIGESGAIAVNEYLQTSDPDIYAIGDCMENQDIVTRSRRQLKLAANAVRTGYIAGRNAVSGNKLTYAICH